MTWSDCLSFQQSSALSRTLAALPWCMACCCDRFVDQANMLHRLQHAWLIRVLEFADFGVHSSRRHFGSRLRLHVACVCSGCGGRLEWSQLLAAGSNGASEAQPYCRWAAAAAWTLTLLVAAVSAQLLASSAPFTRLSTLCFLSLRFPLSAVSPPVSMPVASC